MPSKRYPIPPGWRYTDVYPQYKDPNVFNRVSFLRNVLNLPPEANFTVDKTTWAKLFLMAQQKKKYGRMPFHNNAGRCLKELGIPFAVMGEEILIQPTEEQHEKMIGWIKRHTTKGRHPHDQIVPGSNITYGTLHKINPFWEEADHKAWERDQKPKIWANRNKPKSKKALYTLMTDEEKSQLSWYERPR